MTVSVGHEDIMARAAAALEGYSFTFSREHELHDAIGSLLAKAGILFEREHVAGPRDRFDFLCQHGVVIEVKIHGSFAEAMRQVSRYCALDSVKAVLLVTTCLWAHRSREATFADKPVSILNVGGRAL